MATGNRMIETYFRPLPHGITLSCRAAGEPGRPVLMFLHGFPEAAFVWDACLQHFAQPEHGGYRCVAPNLRGFEASGSPEEVSAYRPKHLVQDIAALIALETSGCGGQLNALIAHDWGGAIAWNLVNQLPHLARQLVIVNSPHPGTYLRELKHNPAQQAASRYMNFLTQPDAEQRLVESDFARLWDFLSDGAQAADRPAWLTPTLMEAYREVWSRGLTGGCNLYRASPLRPPTPQDPGAAAIDLPMSMLTIELPTLVIWGMDDVALPPAMLEGLERYVKRMTIERIPGASHWVLHEQPQRVMALIEHSLLQNS